MLLGALDEHMAIAHAGHGVNSYAMNYQLVHGSIAVLAQSQWGGAYGDAPSLAGELARQFYAARELIEASEMGSLDPRGRLIVIESTFTDRNAVGWLKEPMGDEKEAEAWLEAHRVEARAAFGTALQEFIQS